MIKISHIYIIILLVSNIFSQDCGNDICDNMETYINCIEDCPIIVENLVWIDDISVHIDDEDVIVTINMENLENIEAGQFNLAYNEDVLSIENSSDCYINENFNPNNIFLFVNSNDPGTIQASFFTLENITLNGEFIHIRFKIIGLLGQSSDLVFVSFTLNNNFDITYYAENGTITIGNSGCMDSNACNYSSEATFDDNSCEYEYDCLGECGGNAIEDCEGLCNGSSIEDCLGDCNGSAIVDECDQCDGNMFSDEDDFYPDGACDCNGTQPYIYCIDNDGDLLGDLDSSFPSCIEINLESLVLNCTDADDSCSGSVDACGICDGGNADQDCNEQCFGDAVEDCLGECNGSAIVDECDQCDGNMFIDANGFYPDGSCDCEGTLPEEYCIDSNNDGVPDFTPLLSCDEAPLDIFVDCQTLDIDNENLKEYRLFSAYPNPFNPSITISYLVETSDFITINIIDLNGKHIRSLVSNIQVPGGYSIIWEPSEYIPSGLYFVQFSSSSKTSIKKINYIK